MDRPDLLVNGVPLPSPVAVSPVRQQQLDALQAAARLQVDIPALAPGNYQILSHISRYHVFREATQPKDNLSPTNGEV